MNRVVSETMYEWLTDKRPKHYIHSEMCDHFDRLLRDSPHDSELYNIAQALNAESYVSKAKLYKALFRYLSEHGDQQTAEKSAQILKHW